MVNYLKLISLSLVLGQSTLDLILDPEESEYVLPNDGFVGFLVLLNSSDEQQGSLFIGGGFHNMARISAVLGTKN